ncbi:MAG: hypothetical protein ACRDTV_25160, partial [Mycobacterium sp.]
MSNAKCVSQVGGLAVGLGIGAAVAATPWVASADGGSGQPDPSIAADVALLMPAGPAITPDLAISVDGFTLFQEGTATATSDPGDIAIAFGDGSTATAQGGVLD